MAEAIDRVLSFMDGRTEADLADDAMLFYAVVKNVEIIGEAAYKLSHNFVEAHPHTP